MRETGPEGHYPVGH